MSIEIKAKSKLKYYLLLSSRFFLFLSIISCLYFLSKLDLESATGKGLMYIDNSISNSAKTNGISLFDKVKGFAGEVIQDNEISVISNSSFLKDEVGGELQALDYSFVQLPLSTVIDRFNDSDGSDFYMMSDFQGIHVDDFNEILDDTLSNYYVMHGDLSNQRNAFIDSVFLSTDIDDYSSLILTIRIGTSSNFSKGSLVVKLLSKGNQISSVVKVIEDVGSVEFNIPQYEAGNYEIVLSGDDVEYDNRFFLSIGKSRIPNVSLISSDQRNDFLLKVFESEELFRFNEMNSNSVDFSYLESSDLIILDGLKQIPNGILTQFQQTTVILFPSEEFADVGNVLNKELNFVNFVDHNQYRSILDSNHKLFQGVFNKSRVSSTSPYGSSLYDFKGSYNSIIKLSSGKTFLAKALDQNFYMLSCPLDNKYTNLPIHGIFFPLMYQLATEAVKEVDIKLSYYPGDILSVLGDFTDVPIRLIGDEQDIVPEFFYGNSDLNVKIPPSLSPGFYSLVQGFDTLASISVNLSRSESIMEGLSFNELEEYFRDVDHVKVGKLEENLESNFLEQDESFSLWKIALILVMFFIISETLLHRYLK